MSDSRLLLRRRSKGTILLAITFLLVSSLSGSVLAAKENQGSETKDAIKKSAETKTADENNKLALGMQLFEHEWRLNDPLSQGGDGLGPMFNARSCVACHNQGGSGGGGNSDHNADLLTLIDFVKRPKGLEVATLRKQATVIHAEFAMTDSISLHRFGVDPEYPNFRKNLLGERQVHRLRVQSGTSSRNFAVKSKGRASDQTIEIGQLVFHRTQRNPPALFGAGMIDVVSADTLFKIAAEQPGESEQRIHGKPAGHFGWRGQTDSLREFVLNACANELGLQTEGHPQAAGPKRAKNSADDPDADGKRLAGTRSSQAVPEVSFTTHVVADMTSEQVDALTKFIAALPPPKAKYPDDPQQRAAIGHGAKLFVKAECSVCHRSHVGDIKGIYSDLLTHDMGLSLSEVAGPRESMPGGGSSSYFGSAPQAKTNEVPLIREWRTPPLWGVRLSAPYLHDGRANDLDDAIRMHDGEGAESALSYKKMSTDDRADLLAYVKSLGVP